LVIDALQLEFANAGSGRLATNDSYTSDWVGGKGGQAPDSKPKAGLIVGVSGSSQDSLESLVYYVATTKSEEPDPGTETVVDASTIPIELPEPQQAPADEESDEKELRPSEPVRTWTSATGANTIEARLLSMAQGQVIIETPQGRQIKVPLEKLSEADQKYVNEWRKRRQLGR
jgi:hypothetical protein